MDPIHGADVTLFAIETQPYEPRFIVLGIEQWSNQLIPAVSFTEDGWIWLVEFESRRWCLIVHCFVLIAG